MLQAQPGIELLCLRRLLALWLLAASGHLFGYAQSAPPGTPVTLNRVVAAVNGHAILESDLNEEMHLAVLEPPTGKTQAETPPEALERIIGRTLIRQQIRDEDEPSLVPTEQQVADRVMLMRRELPVCVQADCASDAGWKAFLDAHQLTRDQVRSYVRTRIEVLRFIEQRFRLGIHVSQEQIQDYYRNTLVPEYPPGEPAPPLEKVSDRIEEILLQRQVTDLFSGWLDNMRSQGDIEVLDPSLETATPNQPPVEPTKGVQ